MNTKLLGILLACFLSGEVLANGWGNEPPDDVKVLSIESVYDGDTFRAILPDKPKSQRVRVRGIDTPEIKGKCDYEKQLAIKARDHARKLLFNASKITLSNVGKDYYKRVLATVWVDGKRLDALLIERGLGRKWGGKRENWCQ